VSNRKLSAVVCLILCLPGVQAQLRPGFEVASVKINNSGLPSGSLAGTDKSRFAATNITLKLLLTMAYQVRDSQVIGGPAWVNSDRFDIMAKTETEADWDRMMLMLRKLLEDRFGLVIRRETRELPLYKLVAAKTGLKLHGGNCSDTEKQCGRLAIFSNGLEGQSVMPLFVNVLADMLARPVIDQTNFNGPFNVHMRWTPDESTPGRRSGETLPETSESAPSFMTALEEQLGLKLEPGRGPVETITIEHAEKAVGN
jgi:uncharacterized protein (TIGR03435 family)